MKSGRRGTDPSRHLENLHSDPADRMIIATALLWGAVLMMADQRILDWSGKLDRINARL